MRYSLLRWSTFLLAMMLSVNLCDARGPGGGGGGGGKGGGGGGGQHSGGGVHVGGGGNVKVGGGGGGGQPHIANPGGGGNAAQRNLNQQRSFSQSPGGNAPRAPKINAPNIPNVAPHAPNDKIPNVPRTNVPSTPNLQVPNKPNAIVPKNPAQNLPGVQRDNRPNINRPNVDQPKVDANVKQGNNLKPGNNLPNNVPQNNLPGTVRDNRDNRPGNRFDPRANVNAGANVNANANANLRPHQSFHSGQWKNDGQWNNGHWDHRGNRNNNNATNAQLNAAFRSGLAYSRFNNPYINGGLGYGGAGYGYGNGYGYGLVGGRSGLGSLLNLGLALSGYGGGYGLGGYGNGFSPYGLGGYGGYGLYGGYPIGWGLGGGGLGSLAYMSGMLPYANPYYASNMGGYNYAQPIPTVIAATENPTSAQLFDTAVAQFKSGDYQGALVSIDNAIQQNPNDPAMHEFRALDLFALKNYPSAAATIHSVLAVGPGWNWDTVSNLYDDVDVYTAQLRSLEETVDSNPNQADTRFLLAYHYLVTGHPDAASKQLNKVVQLQPQDKLAADLLKMNSADQMAANDANPPAQPAPQQPAPTATPIDPASIVGTWHAVRDDGSKFDLQLKDDKTFTWTVHQQGKDQNLTGTYDVQKDLLALESPQAGGMVAQVAQNDQGSFNFKLLGAPQNDKGLTFAR